MRNRILRLRHRVVWKVRQLRGRAAFVFIAARESAATFTRIAAMRPLMGGSPEGDPPEPKPDPTPKPDPEPKPTADPPPENKVGEAERRRKKAEKDAADAQKRIEELEGKDATDLEKAQKKAADAERKAADAEERAKKLERGAWVRGAAAKAGAIDAEAVEALVNLDEAEDETTAENLVKELAEKKPKLFGQREGGGGDPPPPGFGTPAGGTGPGGGSPGGAVPGIGADGKVDQAEVRKGLGAGILGIIRGGQQAGSLPGGEPPDDDD